MNDFTYLGNPNLKKATLMFNKSGQKNKSKNTQGVWMTHSTSFKHMFE